MGEILLLLAACAEPKMINASKFPWNEYDRKILRQTQARCGQLYPDAPCVKLFRKFGKQDYTVVCGRSK